MPAPPNADRIVPVAPSESRDFDPGTIFASERTMVRTSLLLIASLFSVCSPTDPDPIVCEDPQEILNVEFGTGDREFEAVTDGDELPLAFGFQGGNHIWLSLRVDGLTSDSAYLEVTVARQGESEPFHRWATRAYSPFEENDAGIVDPNRRREFIGYTLELPNAECLVGVPLDVSVRVTGLDCNTGITSRRIVPAMGDAGRCER